jgi:hypothetical protein
MKSTPKITHVITPKKLAIARRHQREHAADGIGLAGQLDAKMLRDTPDIFHDGFGIFEDAMIQPLHDELSPRIVVGKSDAESVVDVTAAERFRRLEFAGQLELAGDGANVSLEIHVQRSSGRH